MNIVFIILTGLVIAVLFSKMRGWKQHLLVFGSIYLLLLFMWIQLLLPKEEPIDHHRGDPGLGVGLITLFMMPLLLCVHLIFLVANRKTQDRAIVRIHLAGLLICLSVFLLLGWESGLLRNLL